RVAGRGGSGNEDVVELPSPPRTAFAVDAVPSLTVRNPGWYITSWLGNLSVQQIHTVRQTQRRSPHNDSRAQYHGYPSHSPSSDLARGGADRAQGRPHADLRCAPGARVPD